MKCLAEVLYEIVPFLLGSEWLLFRPLLLSFWTDAVTCTNCRTLWDSDRNNSGLSPYTFTPFEITSMLSDSTLFGKLCVNSFWV